MPLGQRVDEAVVDALRHDQARGGRAALAGREEGAVGGALDRDLQIGVVEHDERVLAAHLELHLLHRRRRRAACATLRPVATEPVNEIAATSGCRAASRRLPSRGPSRG